MNDLKAPIDNLKEKVELLITSHRQMQGQIDALEAENSDLKRQLELKSQLIKEHEEKNNLPILAPPISSNNESGNEELKLTITNLVQEIDACIALLGKNV